VIAVNIKDAVVGRVFSMLHEAAHLMLRQGGLCDFEDERPRAHERIEAFCNRVAGATLMPGASVLAEPLVQQHKGTQWVDREIVLLAQRYRVSREAFLRRLLVLGKTTEEFYLKKRKELLAEYQAQEEAIEQQKALGSETGGFAPPDRIAVSKAGPFFVRLVIDSYNQEKITANDLSTFLEVRLKHIPKIEHAVLHRPLSSGAHP
jgi:Zn-dependent peptidase ImmA (M78 family)